MFRFSLRELLALALIFGLTLGALRVGGLLASALLLGGFVFFVAMTIHAFAGKGTTKAFAIGFLIPCLAYSAILLTSGNRELDPYSGKVPSAGLLRYLHQNLVAITYYDLQGNVITDYDPTVHMVVYGGGPSSFLGGFGGGGGAFGGGGGGAGMVPAGKTAVSSIEGIERATFMLIGHGLIALFCGWIGGKYALHVLRSSGEK